MAPLLPREPCGTSAGSPSFFWPRRQFARAARFPAAPQTKTKRRWLAPALAQTRPEVAPALILRCPRPEIVIAPFHAAPPRPCAPRARTPDETRTTRFLPTLP